MPRGLTILIVGVLTFFSIALDGCGGTPTASDVVVPNVLGENPTGAFITLARSHLEFLFKNVASSQPVGTVVSESPTAGVNVSKNSTIRLAFSVGSTPPTTLSLPQLASKACSLIANFYDELDNQPVSASEAEGQAVAIYEAAADADAAHGGVSIYHQLATEANVLMVSAASASYWQPYVNTFDATVKHYPVPLLAVRADCARING